MRSVRMAGYRPMSKGKILVVGAVMLVAIVGTSLQGALPASAATPTSPVLTATTPGDGQVVLDWTASDGGGFSLPFSHKKICRWSLATSSLPSGENATADLRCTL